MLSGVMLKNSLAAFTSCSILKVDRSFRSQDVLDQLQKATEQQGAPEYLRSDNGSEFISKIVQQWLADNQIKTIYIEPGSSWQNGFVESFHGRFRDECLTREQMWTLTEARVVIRDYQAEYNQLRPHSRLGYLSPARFAAQMIPSPVPGMDKQNNTHQHEPTWTSSEGGIEK